MPIFVTVTPGTTITNSTTLDPSTLNLLGTPSVNVVGTVDGGSLSLTPGSVNSAALAANSVTNAKLAQMASNRIKGNNTGSPADPIDLTAAEVKTLLSLNPTGGLETSGTNIQIANGGVSYAKIQNVAATSVIGNPTGSSAAPSAITLGPSITVSGSTLNASSRAKVSAQIAIPANGSAVVTYAHGLAAVPDLVQYCLECISDDQGFVTGQRVSQQQTFAWDAFPWPALGVWADATNVYLKRPSNKAFYTWKTDGTTLILMDTAKWKIVVFVEKVM
jgi:hypothetical protein